MLQVSGLRVVKQQQVLLDNIHIDIKPGQSTALRGISGCGKSTLLKTLVGGYHWSATTFFFMGQAITHSNINILRQQTGYIGQESALPAANIMEALQAPFRFQAYRQRPFPVEKLHSLMNNFSLADSLLNKSSASLSGGQKQSFNIIRTLLLEPSLILADEPTSALDPESKSSVISQLLNSGHTVLSSSHDTDWLFACDRIIEMKAGQLTGEVEYV